MNLEVIAIFDYEYVGALHIVMRCSGSHFLWLVPAQCMAIANFERNLNYSKSFPLHDMVLMPSHLELPELPIVELT